MARRKSNVEKLAKKVSPVLLFVFAVVVIGFAVGGYFLGGHMIKNDKFEIIGEKTITLTLGDEPYQDEGAVAISFGKDITSQIVVETNVDYTVAGQYYIRYSVDNVRYKGVYRYRTIIINEVEAENE